MKQRAGQMSNELQADPHISLPFKEVVGDVLKVKPSRKDSLVITKAERDK